MVTKEHILAEIRRTGANNGGRALGRARFEAETGIRETDWSGRYWTRWNDALKEAGYKPNEMQGAVPLNFVIACLAKLIRELGRFPTIADLKMKSRKDPSFPSHNTFNKLGSKSQRVLRVLDYCNETGDLDDVAEICRPLVDTPLPDGVEQNPSAPEVFGFVYLMKSGKFYKIGRSVCAEKRAYEIKLVLPEELSLIHKIKTDDPVGIEAYWHKRFSDKRLRGEWFNLTLQDVKAFRRRKFM